MPLSDTAIRNAKPAEKTIKLSDGGGLQLWITPAGSKLWNLAYRDLNRKQRKLALGAYPAVGLADARKRREEAKALLASGIDPSQQKKLDKIAKAISQANTFSAIAAELLEKKRREGKASSTLGKRDWLYGMANDALGKRPITEIEAPEILDVLRVPESKGLLETAHRLRAAIGEVFRYAVATGRTKIDPTTSLRGALATPAVKNRAAILDPVEFGALLRAIDGFNGQPTTIAALKLMALLFPRPGELRMAEWREFDLVKAIWTIPAARTKMRREHRVPLPHQAVQILRNLHAITGRGTLVFPGYGMGGGKGQAPGPKPISENTLNSALRRMGYTQEQMSAHGFRATASSLLNESGRFSGDAIERALAHQDPDAVRRAYARGAYWKDRVEMAQWWADEIDHMRDGGKLIPMRRDI